MWTKILAKGVANQPQLHTGPNGGYVNHGYITVTNSLIKDAAEAAVASNDGGVIYANNSRFENNRKGAQFHIYNYPNHQSMFVNCIFETNAQIKAYNNTLDAHITAWAVDMIKVFGCTFKNTAPLGSNQNNLGNGIYSIDATFNIDHFCPTSNCVTNPATIGRTVFKNLNYGIYAQTSTNASLTYTVKNCDFIGCNQGAYFKAHDLAFVQYSNFKDIPDAGNNNPTSPYGRRSPYGLYYDNCQNFFCENNTFRSVVPNANDNLGLIVNSASSAATKAYLCDFADLKVASAAYYDNYNGTVGLKFNCNKYTGNGFDVALLGGFTNVNTDMDHVQGSFLNSDPKNLVRNLYSAVCLPGVYNQWYDDRTTNWTIQHKNHSTQSGNGGSYFTEPQNSCYPSSLLSVGNVGLNFIRTNDCPVTSTDGGGGGGTEIGGSDELVLNDNIALNEQNLSELKVINRTTTDGQPSTSEPPIIKERISKISTELDYLYARKLRILMSNSMKGKSNDILATIENSHFIDKSAKLTDYYISTGNYSQALQQLSNLQNQPEYQNYCKYKKMLISSFKSENGLLSIKANGSNKELILKIANTNFDPAQKQAQALATFLWNKKFPETILLPNSKQENSLTETNEPYAKTTILAENTMYATPNPSSNKTTIYYKLPSKVLNGTLTITDINGKTIIKYEVIASLNQIILDVSSFKDGLYFATLSDGNKTLNSVKFIVSR